MLYFAVCDDTPAETAAITELLGRYRTHHTKHQIHIRYYSDGQALLDAMAEGLNFDLYLLDILMPGMDGITLARALRAGKKYAPIVYLTSSAEHAVAAFSVHAFHYLIKPVSETDLFATLDDALATLGSRAEPVSTIHTVNGDCSLALPHIVYVEVTGHVLHYRLADGRTLHSKVLRVPFNEAAADLLSDPRFLRPHQSFLVNANHISRLLPGELVLDDGSRIPISRLRVQEVRRAYMDYLSRSSSLSGGDGRGGH